jgi:hypothetical protein
MVLINSKGEINITKHIFYSYFKSAFKKAFYIKNIKSI